MAPLLECCFPAECESPGSLNIDPLAPPQTLWIRISTMSPRNLQKKKKKRKPTSLGASAAASLLLAFDSPISSYRLYEEVLTQEQVGVFFVILSPFLNLSHNVRKCCSVRQVTVGWTPRGVTLARCLCSLDISHCYTDISKLFSDWSQWV